jgi:ABC-type multidrug transport system fused ATPase/permease subunit
MEMLGIGLVGPYIALVLNPQSIGGGPLLTATTFFKLNEQEVILIMGIVLICTFIAKTFISIVVNSKIIRFGQSQGSAVQLKLMKNYQSMPYVDYMNRNSAEYIYAITTLSGQFTTVLQGFLRLCGDVFIIILIVIFLAYKNLIGTTIFIGIVGFVIVLYDIFLKSRLHESGEQINLASKELMASVREGLLGIKEVRVFGLDKFFYNRARVSSQNFASYNSWYLIIAGMPKLFMELILIVFFVLFITISLNSGVNSEYLFSTLGIFGLAAIRLLPSANSFVNNLTLLRYLKDAMNKLYEDVKSANYLEAAHGISAPSKTHANPDTPKFTMLEMRDVCFSYPGSDLKALNKISIKIQRGQLIGIIGKSGSGKTTLVNIILGLLSPSSGSILINENPLTSVQQELRDCVAYLPQDTFLIDGSLRQNIALGVDDNLIDDNILEEAVRKAQLEDFVSMQPDGLDVLVGEGGIKISGGQRQRIALARAFYHGREVLVMDEATSALDIETESEVVEEIKNLKGKITIILIAHRLSTLRDCDVIYQIENGTIRISSSQ